MSKAKKKVLTGAERKAALTAAAVKLVGKHGAVNVTRRMVATEAKVSEALVAHYFGPAKDAQKLYRRAAKKAGVEEPSKEKIEANGIKLRAHGPRAAAKPAVKTKPKAAAAKTTKARKTAAVTPSAGDKPKAAAAPRKRSIAEVKAIKDKVAVIPERRVRSVNVATEQRKVAIIPEKRQAPTERRARAPKLPPIQPPVLPPLVPPTE